MYLKFGLYMRLKNSKNYSDDDDQLTRCFVRRHVPNATTIAFCI